MWGEGFLGRGATFGADLNLILEVAIGLWLLGGMALARRGLYRAHGACQTAAILGTVVLTVSWMVPSFREVYAPGLARGVVSRTSLAVTAHAALGTVVLLLGAYVILVAGTRVVPERLRFGNYKVWMRTLLALWWAAIGLGALGYWLANG